MLKYFEKLLMTKTSSGSAAAVGGAVSFAGWPLDILRLASWQGDAIAMQPFQVHAIDTAKCTRCDVCRRVCPVDAIEVS